MLLFIYDNLTVMQTVLKVLARSLTINDYRRFQYYACRMTHLNIGSYSIESLGPVPHPLPLNLVLDLVLPQNIGSCSVESLGPVPHPLPLNLVLDLVLPQNFLQLFLTAHNLERLSC